MYGSSCVDLPDSLSSLYGNNTCECLTGYSGQFCEISDNECDAMNCNGNGSCSDFLGYALCICDAGFSGDYCEIDDFCGGNNCNGRGICSNGACECNPTVSYVASGDNCEILDYCQFTDSQGSLQNYTCNFGTCQQDDTAAFCVCDEGYGDESLGQYEETCEYQDPCLALDCGINGGCFYNDVDAEYQCLCDFGYVGDSCEHLDLCISSNGNECVMDNTLACNNNATNNGYECTCANGFSGTDCDVDACDPVSPNYTCDDVYSDLDSCTVIAGLGVCSCNADSSRTDCDEWGPACDPIATDCNLENTASYVRKTILMTIILNTHCLQKKIIVFS